MAPLRVPRPVLADSLKRAAGAGSLLLLSLFLQWTGGAYGAEFGGHPDEAAHYVTGLLARDYVLAGLPADPMAFARSYYEHYPKIGLGNWPPVFYLIQAGWMILFSPARGAVLLLMALLTCAVAALIVRSLAVELGPAPAWFGAVLFLTLPLVQTHAAMVMAEMPVALFSAAAMLAFARYLHHERTADSLLFAVWASAAIMTKGSGLALALVPPLAVLASRRYHVLRRRNFWYPVPVVAVVCGPWTLVFLDTVREGWQQAGPSREYAAAAGLHFTRELLEAASPVITLFALVGVAATCTRRGARCTPLWAAAAALVVSVLVFHAVVPASQDLRHLVPALPAWSMFAAAGLAFVWRHLTEAPHAWRWVAAAAVTVGLIHTGAAASGKHCGGFRTVAQDLIRAPAARADVLLVSSDASGEGMFIAEIAMLDRRPGRVVRRGSKLFAAQDWSGAGYRLKVSHEEDVLRLLQEEGVDVLVIDNTVPGSVRQPHHSLVSRAAAKYPERLRLRGTYALTRDYLVAPPGQLSPAGISVYEVVDPEQPTPPRSQRRPRALSSAGGDPYRHTWMPPGRRSR